MTIVTAARAHLTCVEACSAVGLPRASYYRSQRRLSSPPPPRRPCRPPRALSDDERREVLSVSHEPRFVDLAVPQIHARLLDEGRYLCSLRTWYRILERCGEIRERRDQLRRPVYKKPELLATAPNQVWSWDITKLRGPITWTYFYLYVVLDIFSRYAVGWMVAARESAVLARELIESAYRQQHIAPGQVTLHADRGGPMKSKTLAQLLTDLDVAASFSRPHVSDDNPFSEAQFKTLKYRPDFPDRFGCIQDARTHSARFFEWYHHEHRHSGLAWMTPADVHFGRAAAVRERRAVVLDAAYQRHPERFVRKPPTPPALPTAVWINPPARTTCNTATQ
jgi:putative transposase